MKIFQVSVLELGVIVVGVVICGEKDLEYMQSKRYLVWVCDS